MLKAKNAKASTSVRYRVTVCLCLVKIVEKINTYKNRIYLTNRKHQFDHSQQGLLQKNYNCFAVCSEKTKLFSV